MDECCVTVLNARLEDFCRRWKIREMALFASAVRHELRPDSDLDILVDFDPDAQWGLLDHVQMQRELQELLGRNVDLLSKRAVLSSHNWLRRQEILRTAQTIYCDG